ncbi:MAG: flavodoxin domain-containing protein [Chloroflexota bacterium]|nr:flavodoxin domain-containing protein [Chloroflexota bacterium]
MNKKILVAYATKYGATAEIAEAIGQTLAEAGQTVEVLPVERVDDLSPYSAVVLGSAVYAGNWRKEAVDFLEEHEQALTERLVWFFSSGPTGEGDPVELMHGWRFPEAQLSIADRVGPGDIAFFHGKIDTDELNLGERLLVKAIRAQVGDYRDWHAIRAWASGIAQALSQA